MTTLHFEQQDTVFALAAADSYVYAARTSGLYRSRDGGKNWQDALVSLERPVPLAVTAVAVEGRTIFAGVKGAILRSDDAAENWQIVGLSSPPPSVVALAISPNYHEDGTVIAGTSDDGVFVSSDRGMSWVPWNFGLIDLHVYALAISPDFCADRTLFAGTESGVFRSHNGGRAWREVAFLMEAAPVLSLGLSPADRFLYAGTENHGLFASEDFGMSWRQVKNDFSSVAVNAVQTTESDLWLLLEDRLIHSVDRGRSWKQQGRTLAQQTAMTMTLDPVELGTVIIGFADGEIVPIHPGLAEQ